MSSHINSFVGVRLQLARKRAGLSELQMAKRLGVEPFVYRDFETGRRRLDAPEMLKCSQIAGVPLSWFFEGYSPEHARTQSPPCQSEEEAAPATGGNVIDFKVDRD